MPVPIIGLFLSITVIGLYALWLFYYPVWRNRRLMAAPFPDPWLGHVKSTLPCYHRLAPPEQQQLLQLIALFLADKEFYGCGGLQITDKIRLTIATQACLLLLNRPVRVYPDLKHILVYPSGFRTSHDTPNEDGTLSKVERGLLGESWHNGKVILSWDDVQAGAADFQDGHNVVLHEFAHQLDTEDGSANGAPLMPLSNLKIWASVFTQEFQTLNVAAREQDAALMDFYGATNPAEFFAVATETYFEKPGQMYQQHPELFEQLQGYYKVDPRSWHP